MSGHFTYTYYSTVFKRNICSYKKSLETGDSISKVFCRWSKTKSCSLFLEELISSDQGVNKRLDSDNQIFPLSHRRSL